MDKTAAAIRAGQKRRFFRRGITFAVASGICYGLYTGFLTLAETQGPWGAWFAGETMLSAFTVTFALAALAAGLNDLFSGIWSLVVCAKNRQLGDLEKTLRTKPGRVMMLCAVVGGPFATVCYVVGLNAATASGNPGVIVPIAALNCAIGTVLSRILFKQDLSAHKVLGIVVCLLAGALIGGASFASVGPEALVGCLFAFLAAFGWGFEGCVAGFGTVLIDYRIGITIRQVTAGVLELLVVFPVLAAVGDSWAVVPELFSSAFGDASVLIFAVSGFFAMPAYSFWYKGNSMCGTALGMACNGMYAFWGPFFIWIILGVLNIGGLSADYPALSGVQWLGALIMVAGIFCIAVDPRSLKKDGAASVDADENENHSADAEDSIPAAPSTRNLPLYYAIIGCFADGKSHGAQSIVSALEPAYHDDKMLALPAVEEALATAKENALLDEAGYAVDQSKAVHVYYRINDFGREMLEKYVAL